MMTVVHSARKLDADGIVEDFWVSGTASGIVAVGTGETWRAHTAADTRVIDAQHGWLTPGFLDLHQHGGDGADYEHGESGIRRALAVHRRHGTTRSLISLVSGSVQHLSRVLQTLATLNDPLVLGTHLEGPFLSPSHRGAHQASELRAPSPRILDALVEASCGTLRMVTLAPELPGSLDATERLSASGIAVAVGHTAADAAMTRRAFDAGARVLTHAFNGMPGIHHRDPGPVVAAIEDERVTLELILDGVHVDQSVARLLFRAAPGRIALVTDAMAAAGGKDGDYRLGGVTVQVRAGVARVKGGDASIAGSTLTQDVVLRGAVTVTGLDPVDAIRALTLTPALVLGAQSRLGLLRPQFVFDFTLLDDDWNVRAVYADGSKV